MLSCHSNSTTKLQMLQEYYYLINYLFLFIYFFTFEGKTVEVDLTKTILCAVKCPLCSGSAKGTFQGPNDITIFAECFQQIVNTFNL